MSRARELSRLGNPNIISADSEYNVGFGTLTPRAKGDFVGVVSATSFYGDGSTLTGVAAAGIGTALSDEKTNPLNKFYYTNQTFTVGTTTSVDAPTSANVAYAQAAEIEIGDGVELDIADGDSLMVDVLGITSDPTSGGSVDNNLYFDTLYGDEIRNKAGTGSPNLPYGVRVSGFSTFTGGASFSGNVSVGGTLTYDDVTNVDSVGFITARKGITCTGIVTATSFENADGTSVGISAGKAIGLAAFLG